MLAYLFSIHTSFGPYGPYSSATEISLSFVSSGDDDATTHVGPELSYVNFLRGHSIPVTQPTERYPYVFQHTQWRCVFPAAYSEIE